MGYSSKEYYKLLMDKITILCGDKVRYNIENWVKSLDNNDDKTDLFVTRLIILSYVSALLDVHLISLEDYYIIRDMTTKGSELNDD